MSAGPDAWHEAGHALAAHLLGGQVLELSLESELDDDWQGHVRVLWPAADEDEAAWREAGVALAGPVAEALFRGEGGAVDPGLLIAWSGDWQAAERALARLHARAADREAARRRLVSELLALFDGLEGEDTLARIADAADAHGTLDEHLFREALG